MKVLLGIAGMVVVLLVSPGLAYLSQPWSPWWLTSGSMTQVLTPNFGGQGGVLPPVGSFGPQPLVSDVERFLLALGAGWSFDEAITATAISIAEDGGGDPAALSPPNTDGSRDFCLLQVNSGWWARFGGQQALADPQTCFNAGHVIYTIQGWCAWSTYDARCGRGHNGAYAAYLQRADAAAGVGRH